MTEEERKDKEREELMDRLKRYEKARREHLGGAINLIFGLATASAGFCIAHIADKNSEFFVPGSYYFVSAAVVFVATVGLCVAATWTRLRDFRLTVRKLRSELQGNDAAELKKLKHTTDRLGKWTWRLFYTQLISFPFGVVLLSVALFFLYFDHVFPKAKSSNNAMQPTTGQRTTPLPMTPTPQPAATRAPASGSR